MTDVKIRRATNADKDAVLNILSDRSSGLDFLPSYYDTFVSNPNYNSFVAVEDQEVVGFYSGHIVDGGCTLVKRGGRVKKSHEGRGIFTQLSKHIDEEVSKIPSVQLEKMNCASISAERVLRGNAKPNGFKLIKRFELKHVDFNAEDIPRVGRNQIVDIMEITPNSLEALFAKNEATSRLIPHKKFMQRLCPLQCIKENIETIFEGKRSMWASVNKRKTSSDDEHVFKGSLDLKAPSRNGIPEFKENTLIDITDSDNKNSTFKSDGDCRIYSGDFSDVTMMSAETSFKCEKGFVCHVEFYAIDNWSAFETHILYHLYAIQNMNLGVPVTLSISVPAEIKEMAFQEATKCLGAYGLNIYSHQTQNQDFYFERAFPAV